MLSFSINSITLIVIYYSLQQIDAFNFIPFYALSILLRWQPSSLTYYFKWLNNCSKKFMIALQSLYPFRQYVIMSELGCVFY